MSNLEEQPQIQLRQGLIRRLRVLVPAILVLTVTSAIVVIVLEGTKPGFVFRCAGLLTMIVLTTS
jgi:peptidoglycan/LPS O-acetylase OafA/YrhL